MVADRRFFSYPFVWLLFISAKHRRRGLGRALLQHAVSLFPDTKVFTSTNESNTSAQRLFEISGFQCCGRVEHLDEGDPEIFYVLLPRFAQSR